MKPFKSEITIDESNFDLFLQLIGAERPARPPLTLVATQAAPEEPAAAEEAPAAEPDSRAYTMTEVRAAATELARLGRQQQLQELLRKHGADRLSALAESEYPAFMKELEAANA